MQQQKVSKSFFKTSLLIFSVKFLNTCATILVMSYFAHKLSKEDYGIYQGFWVQLAIPASIAGLGLSLLIFTYSPQQLYYYIRRIRKSQYLSLAGFVVLVGLIFSFVKSGDFAVWFRYGYLFFAFFLCYVFAAVLESVLFVAKKHVAMLVTNALYAILFVAIALFQYSRSYNFYTLLQLLILVGILKCAMLIYYFFLFLRQNNKPDAVVPEIKTVRETTSLWLHLALYDLSSNLILWIDKVIISVFFSAGIAATYFNGTINIPFVGLALSAVGSATLMQLSKAASVDEKKMLLVQCGRLLSCIAFPIFFFLLFFRNEFITVVFSSKYEDAVPIFLCAILVLPVRAYSSTAVLQNAHKGRLINLGVLLDFIVALAFVIPLHACLGLAGIALSFVLSTYCQFFFYLFHTVKILECKVWQVLPLKNWAVKLLVVGLLSGIAHAVFSHFFSGLVTLIAGMIVVGTVGLLFLKREMQQRTHS